MTVNAATNPLPGLPDIFVSRELISKRISLYMQNKYPQLCESLNKKGLTSGETKSIWYSKEHVQTWLNEMELLGANGMRVYFGEYEADDAAGLLHLENDSKPIGQLCLLMVLTREGLTENGHSNIIYENEPDFESRQQSKPVSRDINDTGEKPRQFNFGAYCPPICLLESDDYPNDSVT
jgi:hypothetical protein